MPASIPRSRNLSPKDISRAAQFTPLALAAAIWCSAAQISQVACNGHNSMQPLITEPRALASGFEDNGIFECRTTLSTDSRTMIRMRRCRIVTFCFLTFSLSIPAAETLGSALAAANVPADQFAKADLNRRITSYAINQDDPFLLAYYDDDASGFLKPPLHVIRYDRRTRVLQRSDIRNVDALFQEETPIDCLGSALSIRESHAIIFIDTHLNPSAGCLILLSSDLSLKTALSGWLLGLIGADYAIIERSEIHFMSVHPLHIEVFDLKDNRSVQVYPYKHDPLRSQYSSLIAPHVSEDWCRINNARCDASNFDVTLDIPIAVNESAKTFGFEATFDAAGFGDDAQAAVASKRVAYMFSQYAGEWEHRQYDVADLDHLFHVPSVHALVSQRPRAPFESPVR